MLGIKNKIILLDYTFLVVKRLINIFLRIFIYLIFSREKKNDFIFYQIAPQFFCFTKSIG